jgi:hypothetical protein
MLAKAEANRKADKEERKKDKEDFLAKLEFNQEQANIMLAKLDANQVKALADRKADKEEMKADIKA